MTRRDLIRHMESLGCRRRREGGDHTIYENPRNGKTSAVPRHAEINTFTARKICRDLEVLPPGSRGAGTPCPINRSLIPPD